MVTLIPIPGTPCAGVVVEDRLVDRDDVSDEELDVEHVDDSDVLSEVLLSDADVENDVETDDVTEVLAEDE